MMNSDELSEKQTSEMEYEAREKSKWIHINI